MSQQPPTDPKTDPKTRLKYLMRRLKGESHTQAQWRAQHKQEPVYVSATEATPASWATQALFALCLFGYLLEASLGAGFFDPIPRTEEGMRLLAGLGAVWFGDASTPLHIGAQPWRLITYGFLHGGLMHILFNSMALMQIGPLIEQTFGAARTLFFWVSTSALAIVLPSLFTGGATRLTVGASGAIFGLIGVAMAYGHRVGTPQGLMVRNKMIEWTVICTLFGMMAGNVAHEAHFGGLASGAALSFLLTPPRSLRRLGALELSLIAVSVGVIAWSAYQAYTFSLLLL